MAERLDNDQIKNFTNSLYKSMAAFSRFSTISSKTYGPDNATYAVTDYSYSREAIDAILLRLAKLEIERQVEFVELSCKNCGGKIQQKYQDPIFKCPYCKTVYAIGYKQVNAS